MDVFITCMSGAMALCMVFVGFAVAIDIGSNEGRALARIFAAMRGGDSK